MARILFSIFIVALSFNLKAQDVSPLHSKGYLGFSNYQPHLKGKGFESIGAWQGVEADFEGMNFSYHFGSIREVGADSTIGSPDAQLFRIGYRIGSKNLNLGSISFLSVGIKPFFQVSGSIMQLSNKVLNDEVQSAGLVFSPGIQLNVSHLTFSASYDAGLFLNTALFGGNKAYNLARGYVGGTTFTIGFENSFDLLAPGLFSLRGYDISKKVYVKDNGEKYDFDRGGYYREVVTTTITTSTPGSRSLALVRPFWGVGPSYSFHAFRKRQAPTKMIGANIGARFWYLMIDGFYESGTMGLQDQVGREEILLTYPQLRDYDFSSQIQAKSYGGRIGFNISKFFALKMNFEQDYESELVSRMRVPFMRLNGFFTMGVTEFIGAPNYTFAGAESKLLDYQSKKNMMSTGENNPSYLPQKSNFTGLGLSIEIGATYFNATWYTYENAAIANHLQYTVGTNIPLGRVFHALRTRYTL